ncbi:MAG TPA: FlgD immunoglobulin-like domain containing protein [Candidatus Udaeobacter sp.]|jgi:hypothetical protein|nr:FlgD immunoglobulin-like domain containing protein [Candidatus Udaeobacter sp.]
MLGRIVAVSSVVLLTGLDYSLAIAAPPPTPGSFSATIVNVPAQKGVQLTWSDVAGEDGYNVYRNGILVTTLGADVTSLFDNEYPIRGDAQYCVEAFNVDGASAQSCVNASNSLTTVAVVESPDWYQDAFPLDDSAFVSPRFFSRATALIGSGRNTAALTGNLQRHDIPQGWARVTPTGAVTRVDLVFRIFPGPGNYRDSSKTSSGLITFPAVYPGGVQISPGDGTFWSKYIASAGTYGTGSPGTNGTPHFPSLPYSERWDPTTWNSERCAFVGGYYITNQFSSPSVKIIPDSLLTPGSHVEYFFRVQTTSGIVLLPDSNLVLQASGERSIDGHRWEEFSVLPDLRKTNGDSHGSSSARTLVVNLCDGHGLIRLWTGVADSTGATSSSQYGSNDGWHALGGGADIDVATNNRLQDDTTPGFIAGHLGQAGTTWDLYTVRGADDVVNGQACSIGSRLAFGGDAGLGPTFNMLIFYYDLILIFTGDRHSGILGPFADRSQDDITMLRDFLLYTIPTHRRGLYVEGEGFVESEIARGGDHMAFLNGYLGVDLETSLGPGQDYRPYSGNTSSSASISLSAPHTFANIDCQLNGDPDVLLPVNGARTPNAIAVATYENVGLNGPYIASVYNHGDVAHSWVTLVDGWNTSRLGTGRGFVCQGCVSAQELGSTARATRTENSGSRIDYFADTFDHLFSDVAQLTGPGSIADAPREAVSTDGLVVTRNPTFGRPAGIRFTVPRRDRVRIDIFDATGRKVRSLVDRQYDAGRWEVPWDGTGDSGQHASSGIYFVRMCQNLERRPSTARVVQLR